MENLVVAFSNIPSAFPIYLSFIKKDYVTCFAVSFVSVASFISHLFESHKHGMYGFGTSSQYSYLLNRVDVVGSYVVISRMLYLLYVRRIPFPSVELIGYIATSFVMLRISEYDKYNANLKILYIPTHCAWHFMAFTSMYLLVHSAKY